MPRVWRLRAHRCIATMLLASLGTLFIHGCAALPSPPSPPADTDTGSFGQEPLAEDFDRSRLIVADFVDALIGVDVPKEPASRTAPRPRLQTRAPDSRFSALLLGALQDAGFDLRIGKATERMKPAAAGDEALLDWQIDPPAAGDVGAGWAFTLRIGRSSLTRRYRADESGVVPLSAMRVRRSSAALTRGLPADSDNAPIEGAMPNLFDTGVSRHAARLAGHAVLSSHVLVFANDSLRLGQKNKRQVQSLAAGFDPQRDLLSVIGCSHGATALSNGNEVLALGRAERIREAFVLAGIDERRVLDEGCWAGRGHAVMPPRGVVVTHYRGSSNG